MSLLTSKQERTRLIKFSIVGVSGTIVDFGLMNFFRLVLGMPLVWAQGISFACAVFNNFLWNRLWTYPESKTKGAPTQLVQFVLINVIGILIRTPLISWLDDIIFNFLGTINHSLPFSDLVLSQNIALAVSIGIVFIWNFFANRYWTYGNVPSTR